MAIQVPEFFTPPDKDGNTLKAILEVAHEGSQQAMSVGAIVWGRSREAAHWISGYAATDDFLRAAMIQRLLDVYSGDLPLVIYSKGLKDLLSKVQYSKGHTTTGGRFKGYDILKPAQEAMDMGQWRLGLPTLVDAYGPQAARAVARNGLSSARFEQFAFGVRKQEQPDWAITATSFDVEPEAATA